jgi:hypothetical protein
MSYREQFLIRIHSFVHSFTTSCLFMDYTKFLACIYTLQFVALTELSIHSCSYSRVESI